MSFFSGKKSKGFSLIEVITALFVFSIIMMAAAGIFANAFSAYRATRSVQRDVENAQYALNVMAKELRTSSIAGAGSTYVKFFDYSRGMCVRYEFLSNSLQSKESAMADYNTCLTSAIPGTLSPVTSGIVSGGFVVDPSTASPKSIGKVTILIHVAEGARHAADLQSTVSLRDYKYVGL